MTGAVPEEPTPARLQLRPLDDTNHDAVIAFVNSLSQRPASASFEWWRYRDCPSMEALVAMAGGECVATMFALRRTYITPDGPIECREPFEWHASEEWRAQAPGLRLVKAWMREQWPMVAVAGTEMAAGLLQRLKWTHAATATKLALPLAGKYLVQRGRSPLMGRAFDLIGRPYYMPRHLRHDELVLEPAGSYSPAALEAVTNQRRFALMRRPDPVALDWLRRAPAAVGHYIVFHARVGNDFAGWVTARVFSQGIRRAAELIEVFLGDDHRDRYPALVQQVCATLAGFGADVLLATTTCDDTMAALRRLKFRIHDHRPVYTWWGGKPGPAGLVLVDGAIADHGFFPVPPHDTTAWLGDEPARRPPR
jgi:hypothetical protein